MAATLTEIDSFILDEIRNPKKLRSPKRVTNLYLGGCLLFKFCDRLPRTDSRHWRNSSDLHNAQELANRSCQRLRKCGLVTYSPKLKWIPVSQ